MPSKILKTATEAAGNALSPEQEASLIQLTWLIQTQTLSEEDVASILSPKNKKNQYYQYLLACLYTVGSENPKVNINYDEALRILEMLAKNHKSTYAMNLYHVVAKFRISETIITNDDIMKIDNIFKKFKLLCAASPIKMKSDVMELFTANINAIISSGDVQTVEDIDPIGLLVNNFIVLRDETSEQLEKHIDSRIRVINIINSIQLNLRSIQSKRDPDNNSIEKNAASADDLAEIKLLFEEFEGLQKISRLKISPEVYEQIVTNVQRIIQSKKITTSEDLNYIINLVNNFTDLANIEKIGGTLEHIRETHADTANDWLAIQRAARKEITTRATIKENDEIFYKRALESENPLAIANLFRDHLGSDILQNLGNDDETLNPQFVSPSVRYRFLYYLKEHFPDDILQLAIAHQKLNSTHYIDELNKLIKGVSRKLESLTEHINNPNNNNNMFFKDHNLKAKKIVVNAWLKFADYYKYSGNDFLKFYALQRAHSLSSKLTPKWLEELGGEKMPIEQVINYMQSFLKMLNIIEKKLPDKTSTNELQNILFTTSIVYSNCEFLFKNFTVPYANHAKKPELSSTRRELRDHYLSVKVKVEDKIAQLSDSQNKLEK